MLCMYTNESFNETTFSPTNWLTADAEKKKYFKIQANHVAPPGAQYSKDSVKRKRNDQEVRISSYQPWKHNSNRTDLQQKQQKRAQGTQRMAKETVRKAGLMSHPLVRNDREIGSRILPNYLQQEKQARIYVSQLHRKKLHQFEPWPDYSIQHVLRNPRSGILIASMYQYYVGWTAFSYANRFRRPGGHRGAESSVS